MLQVLILFLGEAIKLGHPSAVYSSDFGKTWKNISGPTNTRHNQYSFANFGNLQLYLLYDTLYYSTTDPVEFLNCSLSNSGHEIYGDFETATALVEISGYTLLTLDFSSVFQRECTEDDFEFAPVSEICNLGVKTEVKVLKKDVSCFASKDYHEVRQTICPCSDVDYFCVPCDEFAKHCYVKNMYTKCSGDAIPPSITSCVPPIPLEELTPGKNPPPPSKGLEYGIIGAVVIVILVTSVILVWNWKRKDKAYDTLETAEVASESSDSTANISSEAMN